MRNLFKKIMLTGLCLSATVAFAQSNTTGASGNYPQNTGNPNTIVQPDQNGIMPKDSSGTKYPSRPGQPIIKENGTINPNPSDSTRRRGTGTSTPNQTNRVMQNSQDSANSNRRNINNHNAVAPIVPQNSRIDSIH